MTCVRGDCGSESLWGRYPAHASQHVKKLLCFLLFTWSLPLILIVLYRKALPLSEPSPMLLAALPTPTRTAIPTTSTTVGSRARTTRSMIITQNRHDDHHAKGCQFDRQGSRASYLIQPFLPQFCMWDRCLLLYYIGILLRENNSAASISGGLQVLIGSEQASGFETEVELSLHLSGPSSGLHFYCFMC